MRNFKKILALLLATMMVVGLGVTVFAANDYKLTINGTVKDHVYTAYQIFIGSKADKTQSKYEAAPATYDASNTFYEKNGADYKVVNVPVFTDNEDMEAEGAKSAQAKFDEWLADESNGYTLADLYVKTGDAALGDVIWGADIETAGKKALYTAYEMTVADDKLDDAENIKALLAKIADEDNKNTSESDKAVKFANVFFETDNAGNVTAKSGLLKATVTGGAALKADDSGKVVFENLASGYYIVNDSYTPKTVDGVTEQNGVDYSIARIAVQVVGDTEINNKADKVESEKKLKTAEQLLNEKADELGIGRAVNYEVDQKVPNYDGYKYYVFNVRDTMSTGLTFDPASVVVSVGGTVLTPLEIGETSEDGKGYYLYHKVEDSDTDNFVPAADQNKVLGTSTFVIAFEDIMNFAVGADIVITYSATVNSSAVTGINPNTNNVSVDYSNNPDKSDKGEPDYPGMPENTTEHPVGTTPKTYVDTYTTELKITKIDGKTKQPLKDVEFVLTGTSKDVVVKDETVYELDPTGTFYMLKDGTFTETAPQTTPTLQVTTGNSGWVEIVTGDTYDGDDIRTVGGKKYRPFVVATDSALTRYIIVEPNDADYASTTLLYKPVKKTSVDPTAAEEYKVTMVGKTGADGTLTFSQLGAGSYTLSETTVLPGYNDIEDITFTITCTLPDADKVIAGTEECVWAVSDINPTGTVITQGEIEVTPATETTDAVTKGDGKFVITLENNKGTELPSTGGIGTTIFYIVGGLLAVGAGVVLVSKKRMGKIDD